MYKNYSSSTYLYSTGLKWKKIVQFLKFNFQNIMEYLVVYCFILVINDKNVQQNYALFFKILSPRYIVEAAGLNLRGCF